MSLSSILLLLLGVVGLLLALNVLWPRRTPAVVSVVSFFASWLVGELPVHVAFVEIVLAAVFISQRALSTWVGVAGLVCVLLTLCLRLVVVIVSRRSSRIVARAIDALGAAALQRLPGDRDGLHLLLPIPVSDRRVERTRAVPFWIDGGERLELDVFRSRKPQTGLRPIILYVHGGGWSISDNRWEGLPLLLRLAAHGWVGFSANYRLSPRATFPDQIVDVKRAIAWVRAHAAEYGGDPNMIVLAGGSSGAHLAALATLTATKREWQPGFEDADTTVAACVAAYGIYDITNVRSAHHNPGLARLLEKHVFKASEEDNPNAFVEASPLSWVSRCTQVPPFLVLHGASDVLLPVATARAFVAELQRARIPGCAYIELPFTQHAFEIFPSMRSLAAIKGVERFVEHVRTTRIVPMM